MAKFWEIVKIKRRGNNENSNPLTRAIAEKQAKLDIKDEKRKSIREKVIAMIKELCNAN